MNTIGIATRRVLERPARSDHLLRAAFASTRPGDTGLVVLGSLVGARIAHINSVPLSVIVLIAIANGLLCAGSMAFNDWHDVIEDAINKPHRPIVAGRIARADVLRLAILLFAAGSALAWLSVPVLGIIALMLIAASTVYTTYLKRVPLLGNALVAAVHSYPMWCWMLVGAQAGGAYAAFCLAIVAYRFGAELVKTAEDWQGDSISGVRTVATLWGARLALLGGCAMAAIATAVAWYPAASGNARLIYLTWLLPITALTVMAFVELRRAGPPEIAARKVNRLERISIVVATIALAVGLF
jgi:4-hydroxybenzoate polyprenyltransferase